MIDVVSMVAPVFGIQQIEQTLKEWNLKGFRYDLAMVFEVQPPTDAIVLLHQIGQNVKVCRVKSLQDNDYSELLLVLKTYCGKVSVVASRSSKFVQALTSARQTGMSTASLDSPSDFPDRAITFTD